MSGGNLTFWESTGPAGGYEPQRNAESARRLVEKLYGRCESYRDMVSQLQNSGMLDSDVRRLAIQMANSRRWEDGDNLRKEAQETVSLSDRSLDEYRAALEKVEKAHGWEPNDPAILYVLGEAQYRVGSYEDALKTLTASERILSGAGEDPDPVNMAFTAMTLHRIGRIEEAKAALDTWLKEYNESRPHSGKYCFGKTPMQTFLDGVPLAKEKMLNQTVQTTANVA